MKKKLFCLTLSVLMAFGLFALTGCGNAEEESEGESSGRRKCSVYEPGIVLAEVQ